VAGKNGDAKGNFAAEVECFYSRRHRRGRTQHYGLERTDAGDVVWQELSGALSGVTPLNWGAVGSLTGGVTAI
jgi:hypothetical protein